MQIFAIIVSLAVTAVAVVLTTQAVRKMLGVIRIGQPATNRTANPVGRSVTMVKETFLHTRMFQWRWVGVMHWFVYLAFLILSSAVFTGYFQLFDPEFALPIIGHWFVFEWVCEFIGLLSTIGIVFLIVYRQLNHPRSQGRQSRFYGSRQWMAYFVEAMALLEGAAILFIRGAEYNLGLAHGEHAEKYTRFHFPLSSYTAQIFGYPTGADSIGSLENLIFAIATFKILLAMIWLIVISSNLTMGIAWHRFTAWPNIWFKREADGSTALGAAKPLTSGGKAITLDDVDDLDEDSKLGVGAIEDFSWKGILDFTTCTECGRCQSQCPAWNTEKPLSPKLLVMGLREAAYAKAPYLQTPEDQRDALPEELQREGERPLVGDTGDSWFYMPDDASAVIDSDVLWSCTSCGACVQQCPVDIEHVDHIVDMRRYQVLVESNFPAELNGLFKRMESKGNPWGMSPNDRLDWAKDLPFDVKVVGEDIESLDEVEWLFWVGCAGAYEDRAKKTTRAVAELLDMAGVTFGVLGNGETCTGDSARRAGNEFLFQGLAQQNVETLKEYKVKKVVSTCAHCFNTLRNEYKDLGIELEVVHHTQLLNRLVREGKLTPVQTGAGAHKRSITYHDPCYVGRHNGVYTPPRELLQVLPGAEFVEVERSKERSFCCGAGGARMWMEENLGSRINMNRTDELVESNADQIAVGCPFCRVMISDGLTMKQSRGEAREEVEVLDVAQMLLASVKGEQATKLKPGEGAPVTAGGGAAAPVAKAAGGSEPAPATGGGTATLVAEPEAPAAPETPAPASTGGGSNGSGGSSLFGDSGSNGSGSNGSDSNGSSLFGSPDALLDEPAPKKPASSGGSLFDAAPEPEATTPEKPAGGSLFDTPAPAAEKKADLGSSGSLFDTPAEAKAPAAEPAPKAEGQPAEAPAKPAADLGSGGSLFDVVASAEPAKAESVVEPAETPAAEAEPVAETPKAEAPKPAVDLSGGSLFDIAAPAVVEAASVVEPVETSAPEPEAAAEVEPETEQVETPAAEAEESKPAPKPSSGEAHQPRTDVDVNKGGSLFDL
ncbi:4Fe-4S dicluster domain-containing protein [Nocardioides sp. TRM66260-LWL]|uniref:(Fe-S)-binding protein n=1 Tax=Nocardioides sp. TRM66260-LWL TaxID=2874478 RepID=UPI001CC58089|nr:(Fe-S)-binding protein [Nocardioides sp. TRM66260-LWL]MBZ5735736.1 4Fe-4S dicluster domain-containing protein [Nocardioides sp. TRM66260-LWL]